MKILVGPEVCYAGSHFSITDIPGTPRFNMGSEFLDAVRQHEPDIVFLRCVGANNVTPEMIAKCPVPVVGFYHDWICWGSERLETVCQQVDWLITEKTAYEYLQAKGIRNCSHFLMMSHRGVENVLPFIETPAREKIFDVSFLGALIIDGYKDLSRWQEGNAVAEWNNVYWSRLGFRRRSLLLSTIIDRKDISILAAAKTPILKELPVEEGANRSYEVVKRSAINIHLCHGRKYAANRCFETMALGTFLLCEDGNELFDFLPEGLVGKYTHATVNQTIDHYLRNKAEREEMASRAQGYALTNFTNEKLQTRLLALIEDNMSSILTCFNNRHADPGSLHRAPIHHEVEWGDLNVQFEQDVSDHQGGALGDNEFGWFIFDKWTKFANEWQASQKKSTLENALRLFDRSIEAAAHNLIPYWNKAVVLTELGQPDLAAATLKDAKNHLNDNQDTCQFVGSRLETRQSWWFSGHIEAAMALRKIHQPSHRCEASGFLYRADMLLNFIDKRNDAIHWPELPDEYAKIGDWKRVYELDPFWAPDNPAREGISDLVQI